MKRWPAILLLLSALQLYRPMSAYGSGKVRFPPTLESRDLPSFGFQHWERQDHVSVKSQKIHQISKNFKPCIVSKNLLTHFCDLFTFRAVLFTFRATNHFEKNPIYQVSPNFSVKKSCDGGKKNCSCRLNDIKIVNKDLVTLDQALGSIIR